MPSPGGWQRTFEDASWRAVRAVGDQVGSPECAVFPGGAVIPLQHDFAWEVHGIKIDVCDQEIIGTHRQSRGSTREEMLVQARSNAGLVGNRP